VAFRVSRRPLVSARARPRSVRCRRHAVVGFVRGREAGQTHTPVGARRVDALCILTQGHPIVQLRALVHVCGQIRQMLI